MLVSFVTTLLCFISSYGSTPFNLRTTFLEDALKGISSTSVSMATSTPAGFTSESSRSKLLSEQSESGVPLGAWIGIAFAVMFLILLSIVWFVGRRKVTEYFVSLYTRKWRRESEFPMITPQKHWNQMSAEYMSTVASEKVPQNATACSERICIPDIPFAAIDVEPDGRQSPRLPIANKRGSSTGGTPSSFLNADVSSATL